NSDKQVKSAKPSIRKKAGGKRPGKNKKGQFVKGVVTGITAQLDPVNVLDAPTSSQQEWFRAIKKGTSVRHPAGTRSATTDMTSGAACPATTSFGGYLMKKGNRNTARGNAA